MARQYGESRPAHRPVRDDALEPARPRPSTSIRSEPDGPGGDAPAPSRVRSGARAACPSGRQVFRGLPFDLGLPSTARRWIVVDEPLTIPLGRRRTGEPRRSWPTCATPGATRRANGRRAAGRARRPGRPAARALHGRGSVAGGRGAGRSAAGSRSTTGIARLGLGRLRVGQPPRQRGRRLARPAPGPGARTVRAGRPVGVADDHAGRVRDEPDRGDRLRPEPDRRCAPVAPCHRARSGRPEPSALHLEPLAGGRPGSAVVLAAVTLFQGEGQPAGSAAPGSRSGSAASTRPRPRSISAP